MLGEKIPTVATPTARFYYWALSKGVGRELYRTWRREMAYSLALAAVALVISEWRGETSALDAFLLAVASFATVLGCVAVYHLFRIPVVLQGEPNAYDDAKLSCGVAGIVVIAALGIGLIIVVSRVSHIASAPQVVVRTIEWTEHSAASNRLDAKIQTVFVGMPTIVLSGGMRGRFEGGQRGRWGQVSAGRTRNCRTKLPASRVAGMSASVQQKLLSSTRKFVEGLAGLKLTSYNARSG